jgi:protein-L-isoaspartate(D-aspartate) O-methyltransferase
MDAVATAFDSVPRAGFLPPGWRRSASFDGPIPIGAGQTNSQPRTVEAMLRLLEVRPGDRVLDVGSGSGWTTALLAFLTGPDGVVLGVELERRLVAWGADNLASTGLGWARIREATPGVLGAPDAAPYDRILVSADGGSVPQALVDQLTADGRMVLPAAGRLVLVVRAGDRTETSEHGHYRFVPLR